MWGVLVLFLLNYKNQQDIYQLILAITVHSLTKFTRVRLPHNWREYAAQADVGRTHAYLCKSKSKQ